MAENKKGFVLYADYIHTFDKLTDDMAGRLIKIIMAYVNDQNPIIHDLLLQVAFEPIKQALKRDLRAWEDIRLKRSEAGRKSMMNRYNGFVTNPNTVKQSLTEPNDVKQSLTPLTVTVNDTVNVNVNDNVTVSVKKNKKENKKVNNKLELPHQSAEFAEAWNNLLSTKKWRNKSEIALNASLNKLKNYSEKDGIEMINNSIAGEWQSLVELKKPFEKKSNHLNFIETTLKNNETLTKKYSQDDTAGK